MDIRSNSSVWQSFFKFFQPDLLSVPHAKRHVQPQTQQAVRPPPPPMHFSFDPSQPMPNGPIRRGMLVDIVV